MIEQRRGIILVKAMVTGAVTLVVVLVAVYALSDVWRTKMDAQYDEFSHWTDENIAEDPLNYLNFMEGKTRAALEQLEANRIGSARSRSRLASTRDEAANAVEIGNRLLREIRDKYQDATEEDSWPITWKEQELDELQARQQVRRLHEEVEHQRQLRDRAQAGLDQLEQTRRRIAEARNQAEMQLSTISSKREMVRVEGITEDLKDQMVDMKGVLQGVAGVAETSGSRARGLEDLAASEPDSVSDDEIGQIFDSIEDEDAE